MTIGTWATRSSGADGIKNEATDHEKGGGDEGDPQEGELRSGQRRDEVRRKSDSGHSFRFFLDVYLIRPVLWNPPSDEKMVEESTLHVDCMNRSLSPRYLMYAYCRSKLDFLLRVD